MYDAVRLHKRTGGCNSKAQERKNDWERLGLYPGASKYVSLVDLSNALYFFIK